MAAQVIWIQTKVLFSISKAPEGVVNTLHALGLSEPAVCLHWITGVLRLVQHPLVVFLQAPGNVIHVIDREALRAVFNSSFNE